MGRVARVVVVLLLSLTFLSCSDEKPTSLPDPTGTVLIDAEPDSIAAPWSITGSGSFSHQGTGDRDFLNVPTGTYAVTWGSVDDWMITTVAPQTKFLAERDTVVFKGIYIQDFNDQNSVFVSTGQGDDSRTGTRDAPKQTIAAGIEAAWADAREAVVIAAGLYEESIDLRGRDGVRLFGGFSDDGSWDRDPGAHQTTVRGSAIDGLATVLLIQDVEDVGVDGLTLEIQNPAGPGQGCYTVYALEANGLTLSQCIINAGHAANGADGSQGDDGSGGAGGNGGPGGDAVAAPQYIRYAASTPGETGTSCGLAAGGAGSDRDNCDRWCPFGCFCVGVDHSSYNCAAGIPDGEDGAPGADGQAGIGGAGAEVQLVNDRDVWAPRSGASGTHGGCGAGGGGGSSSCSGWELDAGGDHELEGMADGGDGGDGGGGGRRGSGGKGGGSSFALFLTRSEASVIRCVLRGGQGGDGGNGGAGGDGASGEIGEPGQMRSYDGPELFTGGNGGMGGDGGDGGPGGGGAGGDSYCIGALTSTLGIDDDTTFEAGILGRGGNSPAGAASRGEDGVTGDLLELE